MKLLKLIALSLLEPIADGYIMWNVVNVLMVSNFVYIGFFEAFNQTNNPVLTVIQRSFIGENFTFMVSIPIVYFSFFFVYFFENLKNNYDFF